MYRLTEFVSKSSLLALSALLFILPACDKDDEEKVEYTITATADGDQEVDDVTTNGTGTVSGTYNKNTNRLTYTATWQDLSGPATNMHFHGPALAGVSAGVVIPITGFTNTVEGNVSGSADLTEEQEADLLAGEWYYNVHTAAYPPGEIRGQVTAN